MLNTPQLSPLCRHLCMAGLFAASQAAFAQTAPATNESRAQATQEIIVTAQKIAQPVLKTPVALSAITGDDLKAAGVTNAIDLADNVPSVWISQDTGKAQIAIRGVASTDMTEKGDPSAAFHIDGAYISRAEAQLGSFFDLERVEVLRGPQGTLYGRNATAGALNVITHKPERKFSAKLGAEFGNYNTVRLDGMINVPLNETFSLRAAVNSNKHDSYLKPGPNSGLKLESQDDYAGRVHLLANFTKSTSLLVTAETSHVGGGPSSPVPITNFFSGTVTGNLPFSPAGQGNNVKNPIYVDRGSDAQLTAAWNYAVNWPAGTPLAGKPLNAGKSRNADALRGEFKTSFGSVDLTYQLAHLKTDLDEIFNGVFFGFPFFGSIQGGATSTSHELRLNNNDSGPLRWVAGAYKFDEQAHRETTFRTLITAPFGSFTVTVPFRPVVNNQSNALFGQATYSLSDSVRVTAGVRVTRDEKSGSDPLAGTAATAPATSSPAAYNQSVKFSNTSYRLGLDYDLDKTTMLYGALATGYKAGGFNDQSLAGTYKPEQLASLEGGVKGKFLNNALQLSAGVFHYNYKDLQLASVSCPDGTPASCGSVTTNAAAAKVDGAEFEGRLNVGTAGRLNMAVSLVNAKFKDYKPINHPVNDPTAVVDWSGQRLDRAPASTVNLGYTHTFRLGSGADFVAYVGTRYSAAYMISTADDGAIRYTQPAFHKSDASLTYNDPSSTYNIQLFVKNIENKITFGTRVPGSFAVSDPRTFGVRGSYNF